MSINRTNFNLLINDDGTNLVGPVWDKAHIKDVILDPVDAEITVINAAIATKLPLAGGTLTGSLSINSGVGNEFLQFQVGGVQKGLVGLSGAMIGDSSVDIALYAVAGGGARFYVNGPTLGMFLSSAGLLSVNGFGVHTFGGSGNANNSINISNASNGNNASASIVMDNDVRGSNLTLRSTGSGFNDSYTQDGVTFRSNGAGGLALSAQHGSGSIRFHSGGTALQWTLAAVGGLIANGANASVAAGALSAIKCYAGNPSSATGDPVTWNTSTGEFQRNPSSARYKEHIARWAVTPDALRQFVALSPNAWDYKEQQSGAAGFIAEDLDALDIRNHYGRSPLINYDADGRPESNRDFAIIGLQHLVIQNLWRRVAALEGRL